MRLGVADTSDPTYFNKEVLLNQLKLISVNSGTERILAVGLVDSSGNLLGSVTTATLSNVSGSASNVTLVAANTSRKGLIIFNDSTAILYIKLGATATTSSFSIRLTPYGTYEMNGAIYQGIIDGIWASANGSARITEL